MAAPHSEAPERNYGFRDFTLIGRLWPYVRGHDSKALMGLALTLLVAGIVLALPWLQGLIVSDLSLPGGLGDSRWRGVAHSLGLEAPTRPGGCLLVLAGAFAILNAMKFLGEAAQMYVIQRFGQHVIYDLRTRLFAHIQRLGIRDFQRIPVGTLVTRVTNDIEALNEFLTAGLVTLWRDFILVIGACVVMPLLVWDLGLVALALLPVVLVAMVVFRVVARRAYREVVRLRSKLNAFVNESILGMDLIQVFAREQRRDQDFRAINDEYLDRNLKSMRAWAVFSPLVVFFSKAALALVLAYGAHMVIDRRLDIGRLAAFVWWTQLYFNPVRDLAEKYNIFQAAMASLERVFTIMDMHEDPALHSPTTIEKLRGRIEFDRVSFHYRPDMPVLRDVSFHVEPGQRLALVGHTGAGKTTVIRLVLRVHDPQQGAIRLDGIPLSTLEPRSVRRRIGVVPQEVFLFDGSIRENLRLFDESIGDEAIWACARRVRADRFIERRPEGLDFLIHEGGVRLSAGERQLLSFCRALVFEPDLLVLDEATALVDTATERLIQEALEELTRGRSSVLIAHRLSTIRHADLILVMHQGRIVERGSHQELLALGGRYAELYATQIGAAHG